MFINIGINIFYLFIFLAVVLIGLPLLDGLISYYLARNLKGYMVNNFSFKSQYWLGGLGVIIHELGHAAFALIFGHKITQIKLLNFHPEDGSLGSVESSYNPRSWYQTLSNFFIGLGPLFSGLLVCWLLVKFLCHPIYTAIPVDEVNQLSPTNIINFIVQITTTWLGNITTAFLNAGIVNQLILIILIGMISSTVFSLSSQDLHSSYTGLPSFFMVITALSIIGGFLESISLTFQLTLNRILLLIAALWLILLILIFVCLLLSLVEMWLGSLLLRIR
ncbi:hypothetical protein [Fructilactobacillus frigidiflavus]|uniref:hypothetical protein n=1 Tax=Fructilactobacillus frigidiflavus TaxID=3242688 RepID=UPI0037579751